MQLIIKILKTFTAVSMIDRAILRLSGTRAARAMNSVCCFKVTLSLLLLFVFIPEAVTSVIMGAAAEAACLSFAMKDAL